LAYLNRSEKKLHHDCAAHVRTYCTVVVVLSLLQRRADVRIRKRDEYSHAVWCILKHTTPQLHNRANVYPVVLIAGKRLYTGRSATGKYRYYCIIVTSRHSKPTHSFKISYNFNFHDIPLADLQRCLYSTKSDLFVVITIFLSALWNSYQIIYIFLRCVDWRWH